MKKSILLLAFCAAVATISFAQDKAEPSSTSATVELAEGKAIDIASVPANVKEALGKTAYKVEDVTEVFEVTVDQKKHYKFIVNQADGKRAVIFDATGTMKDDKKVDQ